MTGKVDSSKICAIYNVFEIVLKRNYWNLIILTALWMQKIARDWLEVHLEQRVNTIFVLELFPIKITCLKLERSVRMAAIPDEINKKIVNFDVNCLNEWMNELPDVNLWIAWKFTNLILLRNKKKILRNKF